MNDASETAGENNITTTQSMPKEAEDCEASDEYSDSAADIEQSLQDNERHQEINEAK